jgi:magnesium transporter
MARLFKKRSATKGQAPGSLIFVGNQKVKSLSYTHWQWNNEQLETDEGQGIPVDFSMHDGMNANWIAITGIHDVLVIEKIQQRFNLHPMLAEDIVSSAQRPKLIDYGDYLFVTLKTPILNPETEQVITDQISFILGEDFLISFEEQQTPLFDAVKKRIQQNVGRIRKSGDDYLLYALLDTVIDNYVEIIEQLGSEIDEMESNILSEPEDDALDLIKYYRHELRLLGKILKPIDELSLQMQRSENSIISAELKPFIIDLRDLVLHASESIDSYKSILQDYLVLYQNASSMKMNEIMKVLTMFSAFFIPLSFLAGVYGTNFANLPETQWTYGYAFFWGLIILTSGSLVIYFKRKGWF